MRRSPRRTSCPRRPSVHPHAPVRLAVAADVRRMPDDPHVLPRLVGRDRAASVEAVVIRDHVALGLERASAASSRRAKSIGSGPKRAASAASAGVPFHATSTRPCLADRELRARGWCPSRPRTSRGCWFTASGAPEALLRAVARAGVAQSSPPPGGTAREVQRQVHHAVGADRGSAAAARAFRRAHELHSAAEPGKSPRRRSRAEHGAGEHERHATRQASQRAGPRTPSHASVPVLRYRERDPPARERARDAPRRGGSSASRASTSVPQSSLFSPVLRLREKSGNMGGCDLDAQTRTSGKRRGAVPEVEGILTAAPGSTSSSLPHAIAIARAQATGTERAGLSFGRDSSRLTNQSVSLAEVDAYRVADKGPAKVCAPRTHRWCRRGCPYVPGSCRGTPSAARRSWPSSFSVVGSSTNAIGAESDRRGRRRRHRPPTSPPAPRARASHSLSTCWRVRYSRGTTFEARAPSGYVLPYTQSFVSPITNKLTSGSRSMPSSTPLQPVIEPAQVRHLADRSSASGLEVDDLRTCVRGRSVWPHGPENELLNGCPSAWPWRGSSAWCRSRRRRTSRTDGRRGCAPWRACRGGSALSQ